MGLAASEFDLDQLDGEGVISRPWEWGRPVEFLCGDGRFEAGIDDEIEDVGGPEPESFAS